MRGRPSPNSCRSPLPHQRCSPQDGPEGLAPWSWRSQERVLRVLVSRRRAARAAVGARARDQEAAPRGRVPGVPAVAAVARSPELRAVHPPGRRPQRRCRAVLAARLQRPLGAARGCRVCAIARAQPSRSRSRSRSRPRLLVVGSGNGTCVWLRRRPAASGHGRVAAAAAAEPRPWQRPNKHGMQLPLLHPSYENTRYHNDARTRGAPRHTCHAPASHCLVEKTLH